jgi:hypothetical protein
MPAATLERTMPRRRRQDRSRRTIPTSNADGAGRPEPNQITLESDEPHP